MFLLCMPAETRSRFGLWNHPRERLKAGACLLGIIVGAVTLGLSAARLPGALGSEPVSAQVNVMLAVSVAFSVVALVTGFVSGYILLRQRAWNAYKMASCALAALALAAGSVVTGLNFWLLETWAPAQPPGVFNETLSWEQDTAKAGGFGIVLVVAACVHLLVLCTDADDALEEDGERSPSKE